MKLSKRKLVPFLARCMGVAAIAVGGLLLGAQPASAQTCIQDVWKAHGNNQNLTCSAKDVNLSNATNISILTGGTCDQTGCTCFAGGTVTFTADFEMDLTADTRYDVGFYLATDSDPNKDGAITGQCTATASTATNTVAPSQFTQLDPAPDACGDITGPLSTSTSPNPSNPLFVRATISAPCPTAAGQQLQLPWCTTWRQPGSNQVCLGTGNGTTTNDVYPGSPSKCNCGTLTLNIFSETAKISVVKTALTSSVLETTGGAAEYSVAITNNGSIDVTLTSLTDDKYGDITQVHSATGGFQAVTATNCTLATIAPKQTFTCNFTGTVPPGAFPNSFTDTVTGCANNITDPTPDCEKDDATVPYANVAQPPTLTKTASGAVCQVDVTYNVVVTNNDTDPVTLNTLNDSIYSNITQVQGKVISTTCGTTAGALPTTIAVGGNYSCMFVGRITSCNDTVKDTVTGTTTDIANQPGTVSDDATVTVSVTMP